MQKGQAQAKLAIADQDTASIHIYDARGGSSEPAATIQPHRAPVLAMRFNSRYDTVISVDAKGKLAHCTCPARQRRWLRRVLILSETTHFTLCPGLSAQTKVRVGSAKWFMQGICYA